jgi:hypothetical protein
MAAVSCLLTIRKWIAERIFYYGTGLLLRCSIHLRALGCM